MEHVSATEAQNNFGLLIDNAQHNPIMIRKRKRDYAVVISAEEYKRLQDDKKKALIALADNIRADAKKKGLTSEKSKQLLQDI